MTTDRIALLRLPVGYIATRDELALVQGDSTEEVIANLCRTAPDVKAVYFYPQTHSYKHINETIGALKTAGFKNIKLVNDSSWYETEQLHRLLYVNWNIDDYAAFIFSNDTLNASLFSIYEKTVFGYTYIGDNESCAFDYLHKCRRLKSFIVSTTDDNLSEPKKQHLSELFTAHYVHFIGNEGQNWLKCIWDEYDGKVKNFLPAPFTLNVRFKYGNSYHMEKINYSELPFKKVFDLDVGDAPSFEIFTYYNDSSSAEKFYSRKFEGTDSLVLKITLTVGYDFIPEVDFICERYDNNGVVYFIDYIFEAGTGKEYFTASIITAEGTQKVVDQNYFISDVFKELEAKRGTAKLRGVFIDYFNCHSFPVDTHNAVIRSLPSPDTKVCVGKTHSNWAIHLWNSGVQVPVGEGVVIRDWTLTRPEYFYLRKTLEGFQVVQRSGSTLPDLPFSIIIGIVNGNDCVLPVPAEDFPSKVVVVSKKSNLLENVRHDYAWQFFNNKNFYGCMVEPYRGVTFYVTKNLFEGEFIDVSLDCNCGTIEKNVVYRRVCCPDEKWLTVLVYYVGYYYPYRDAKFLTSSSGYIHIKLALDDQLMPIVTLTESDLPILTNIECYNSAANELKAIEPERVALLYYPNDGFVATRDELTKFNWQDYNNNEMISAMYQAAPDVIYLLIVDPEFFGIITALADIKNAGYSNIKVVNANSWVFTEFFYRSSVTLSIGECLTIGHEDYIVYEKTVDGHALVGDQNCKNLQLQKCPKIKHILIPGDSIHSAEYKDRIRKDYQSQIVHFVQDQDKSKDWLKCMWDEHDGKFENFLPAPFTLDVCFKYGINVHFETVDYSQLPFKKTFELDIDDVCKLDVGVKYDKAQTRWWCVNRNNEKTEHLRTYTFAAGENRVLVSLEVGFLFIPEVDVTVIKGVVYSIDFDPNSKHFIGTLIEDGSHTTVEDSADVSDVFKQLDDLKGTRKLKGVYVDYPSYNVFPLDVHRSVVQSLPTPNTKLYFGRPHSEWSIHLWNSRVQLEVGEQVVITNWTSCAPSNQFFCFEKTVNGFCFLRDYCEVPSGFHSLIVIVEEKTNDYTNLARRLYPYKNIIFSEKSKLLQNVRYDYVWQCFSGLDFYGYMVQPHYGVSFLIENGGYDKYNRLLCDPKCGTLNSNVTYTLNKSAGLKFFVFMCCLSFPEKLTIINIPMPDSDFGYLNICMDEKLTPTVTFTESGSPFLAPAFAIRNESNKELLLVNGNSDSVLTMLRPLKHIQVDSKFKKSVITTETTASDVSTVQPPTVILTFTNCNQVLIAAGPDYTGDTQFPAYLRLKHKNGRHKFVIGEKAKAALKTHRESVIYDIPGLLAANLNSNCENATWTFATSRADDGSLLIHLNDENGTSPVFVFGLILQTVIQNVNDHLTRKLERVGIRLPNEVSVLVTDLYTISTELNVELIIL